MKHNYIKQVFTDLEKLKADGIYFSGIKGEGEYKLWYSSRRLFIHAFYKNNKLNGEYKLWREDGRISSHKLFKNDKLVRNYLI